MRAIRIPRRQDELSGYKAHRCEDPGHMSQDAFDAWIAGLEGEAFRRTDVSRGVASASCAVVHLRRAAAEARAGRRACRAPASARRSRCSTGRCTICWCEHIAANLPAAVAERFDAARSRVRHGRVRRGVGARLREGAARHRRSIAIRGRLARRPRPIAHSASRPPFARATSRRRAAEGPAAILAAFTLNELTDAARDALLRRLLERARRGDRVLVVEPLAGFVAPWWGDGGRRSRRPAAAPTSGVFARNCRAIVEKLDRAAGLIIAKSPAGRCGSAARVQRLSLSMTSHWEMRVALAAFEAEALAIAPLHGWGLVLPVADGLVSYQMSPPWGTHVNIAAGRGSAARPADADFRRPADRVRGRGRWPDRSGVRDARRRRRWWRSRCRAISGCSGRARRRTSRSRTRRWRRSSALAKRIVERSREPESDESREAPARAAGIALRRAAADRPRARLCGMSSNGCPAWRAAPSRTTPASSASTTRITRRCGCTR